MNHGSSSGSNRAALSLEHLLGHQAWAVRLARSLVRDHDDADDLVQDTWIAAWRHPPDARQAAQGWLRTVLRNTAINRHIQVARRMRRERAAAAAPAEATSPHDLLEQMQLQRMLADLVLSLPDELRQPILLKFFEGRSSSQIGKQLGLPASTVRFRLARAMEQLRAGLRARTGEDRPAWMGLLAPLLRSRLERRPAVGGLAVGLARLLARPSRIAGGVLLAAIAGLALWWVNRAPSSPAGALPEGDWADQRHVETAGQVGLSDQSDRRPMAVAPADAGPPPARTTANATSCRAELEQLQVEVIATENAALSTVLPDELYRRGGPNPRAATVLRAPLEKLLAQDATGGPAYSLDCRTFACRLVVFMTAEDEKRASAWMGPLQRGPDFGPQGGRIRWMAFTSGGRRKDPVSGALFRTAKVFLSLAVPSGEVVPVQQLTKSPPRVMPGGRVPFLPVLPKETIPPDVTVDDCSARMRGLRERLERARQDLEEHRSADEAFDHAPPNTLLTARVRAALGAAIDRYQVECRGRGCRFNGRAGSAIDRELAEIPELARLLGHNFGLTYEIVREAEQQTRQWLQERLEELKRPSAFGACLAQHPSAAGRLSVTLAVEPSTGGDLAVVAEYDGDLFGTPVGDCIVKAWEAAQAALVLPRPAVPTSVRDRLKLPLDHSAEELERHRRRPP